MAISEFVWLLVILILSAIPLNLAVKLLGGRSSLFKVLIANILVAILVVFVRSWLGMLAGLVSFVVMLFVYKIIFDIGWIKAFLAWLLQFVIIAVIVFVLTLFGISLLVL